jgi:ferredoxin
MAQLHVNFTVHFVNTSVNLNGDVKSGRISATQLEALAVEAKQSQILACGGAAFVDEAKRLIGDDSRFQAEAFSPAIVPVTDERKQNFTVELLQSGRTITVSNQEPLLVALENQGVAVQSGCRMGICNSCICDVKQGSTKDINSGVQNKADGAVKLCVSRASSSLQLDL